MRTTTRAALAMALGAAALTAAAPAALAVDVHQAHDGVPSVVRLVTGPLQFTASPATVSCASGTLTATIANGAANPQGVAADLAYANCTSPFGAATVACTGVTLDVNDIAANDQVDLDVNLPNQACTAVLPTCTIQLPDDGAGATGEVDGAISDRGAGVAAAAALTRTSLPYTTSGGIGCLWVAGGFGWLESAAAGNLAFAEALGFDAGANTEVDLRPNAG